MTAINDLKSPWDEPADFLAVCEGSERRVAGGRWDLLENTADKVRASDGGYERLAGWRS